MLVSEFFPAWYIGRNPIHQIIAATYSFERAGDTGRKIRNQLVDPIHKTIFPACSVSSDNKGANRVSTDQGGNIFSVGVGGAMTGRGAHCLLIDDPIKDRQDAESEARQRQLRDWFKSVAYTRLMKNGKIVIILTRWSYHDLAGWLLAEKKHENWTVLSIPALCEDTSSDPLKRQYNEALWPEFYPYGTLVKIKRTIGTRDWNALYQQRPLPEEGGLVKIDWFRKYSHNKWAKYRRLKRTLRGRFNVDDYEDLHEFRFRQIVCSWDTAFKEKEINDPSACTIWGVTDTDAYLLFVINERFNYPRLRRCVMDVHDMNRKYYGFSAAQVPVLIEDKASGQSLIQDLRASTNIPVIAIKADANKTIRLQEVTAIIEAGKVWLPTYAMWLTDYETQLAQFPHAKHDDMVDSTSQFLRWWGKPKYTRSRRPLYWK